MTPINDASFFMTAKDIPGCGFITVKIESTQERLADLGGHHYELLTAKFQGMDKELPLNEANQKRLSLISDGEVRESWAGMTVDLYVTKVETLAGRKLDVVRVRLASGEHA